MNLRYISMRSNDRITYALCGLLLSGSIIDLLSVISIIITGTSSSSIENVVDAVGILLFIVGLITLLSKNLQQVIVTTLFFSILWLGSSLIYPQNSPYVKENAVQFFIYVLPFCWIGYELVKSKVYLKQYLLICRFKLIIAVFTQLLIFIFPRSDIFNGDYMNSSNAMLVGIIAVYYLAAKYRRVIDVILSIVSTVIVLISGSRGVFLSLIIFWILFITFEQIRHKAVIITGFAAILFIGSFFSKTILEVISKVANSIGFSTHLIDSLNNSAVLNDSNRMFLFENFWAFIVKKPLGYGVMGDRYLSYTYFYNKPIYPHNLVLELMVNFGLIFGGIISIILLVWIGKKLIFSAHNEKACVLVLSCSCLIKLMVSGSFWNDQIFFMLIGALLAMHFFKEEPSNLMKVEG